MKPSSSSAPSLSVVIATHNRPYDVRQCLASLMNQQGIDECQVIVVDSASNDACRAELGDILTEFDSCSLTRLDQPGVSRARNVGAGLARAEWIATLDDDAVPDPQWLQGALEICREASATTGLVQGRVNPGWPGTEPKHVGKLWSRYLSVVQRPDDGDMTGDHECAGANMLVRRSALSEIGGYNEKLGRVGSTLISGIDTALAESLVHRGYRLHYSNKISVRHRVDASRLQKEWITRRAYMEGCAQVVAHGAPLRSQIRLVPKLMFAIPVLEALGRLHAADHEYLIRKHLDMGMLSTIAQQAAGRLRTRRT